MSRQMPRRRGVSKKLGRALNRSSKHACEMLEGRVRKQMAPSNASRPMAEPLEMRTLLSVAIFNGGGLGYVGLGGQNPPDTCGAAGPISYIEVINGNIELFPNKEVAASAVTGNLNTFLFTTGGLTQQPNRNGADSSIVYDDLMGRFIVGDLDADAVNTAGDGHNNTSNFNIAVSTSNNPTTLTKGDWNFYQIVTTQGAPGATSWGDYPGNPGYNRDAFVMTFNLFGGGPSGTEVVSINANDLANGVAPASLRVFQNVIPGQSFRPTSMHDSVAGDPMWLLQDNGDGLSINVTKMTNVLANSTSVPPAAFTNTSLPLPHDYKFSPLSINPLNPNGGTMSDIDSRILKAGEFNKTIVATQKVQPTLNQLDAQWYAIDVSSGPPTFQSVGGVANVGRVDFGNNTYSFDPAIDINSAGEIGLTFDESDQVGGAVKTTTGGYVSTFVTARKPTDAAGTMEAVALVPAGTGFGTIVTNATATITGASITSPIVITTSKNHGYNTGDRVNISGVTGNTNANGSSLIGFWVITVNPATPNQFTLNGSSGNGLYAGGGTAAKDVTRIGDFSGLNVDPVNGTFWAVNEVGNNGSGGTAIANFSPNFAASLNGQLMVSDPAGLSSTIVIFQSGPNVVIQDNSDQELFPIAATSSIVVHGNDGDDIIRTESDGGIATSLYGDAGNDIFDFSFTSHNVGNIAGFSRVFGGAGSDNIFVYDNANTSASTYTIEGDASRNGFGGVDYANDVEGLTLTTGTGSDTVEVESAPAGTPIYLNSAFGVNAVDTVNIGNVSGLGYIAADVQVQNTPNFSIVNINDTGNTVARNATVDINAGFGYVVGLAPTPAFVFWKLSDVTAVNITSGSNDDTINIHNSPIPLTYNSSGDLHADTVNLGNTTNGMQGITANVTLLNSADVSDITLDDTHDSIARTITQSTVTINGGSYGQIAGLAVSGALIQYKYIDTNSVTVDTSQPGGNIVNLLSALELMNIIGHAPSIGPRDAINFGNAGSMSGIIGAINLSNINGSDDIAVNDFANASVATYTLSSVPGLLGVFTGKIDFTNSEITYNEAHTHSLSLTAGLGGSTVNDYDSGVPTTLSEIAFGHFVANVFATQSPLSISHYGSGVSGMTVNLGSAAVLGTQTGNVQAIGAPITITSSDHCAVTVDDSNDTAHQTATLTSSSLIGLSPGTIAYPFNNTLIVYGSAGGTTLTTNSTTSVTEFDGGAGNDMVNVESAPNTLNVNGAGGTDSVNISPVGKNLDAISGTITCTGSKASTLNINDQSNPNFIFTQYAVTSTTVNRIAQTFNGVTVVIHSASIANSGFGTVALNTGAVAHLINVDSNLSAVIVNAGAGDANDQIGNTTTHSLLGITAPVTINGTGTNAITMDDSGVAVPAIVHITPTSVGATLGDTLFGPGGSLIYSGAASLSLSTPNASGGDTIYGRPSPTTAYTINGGLQAPALGALPGDPLGSGPTSGDVLVIADADATNPQSIPGASGAGQYTFANRMVVNYTGVEQTSQDRVPPSVVNPSLQFATLPQSLVVPFSENLAAGPPLSSFSVVPTGGPPTSVVLTGVNFAGATATVGIQGMLPDGNYNATVINAGITDVPGNLMAANQSFDFFMLAGDANHDRFVNTLDFAMLAQNFNKPGMGFSQGDFNYDGKVNALDFNILATKFGTHLLPAASAPVDNSVIERAASAPTGASSLANLFSTKPIKSATTSDLVNAAVV